MNELNALETKPVNRRMVVAGMAGIGAAALIGTKLTSAQTTTSDDDNESDDDTVMDAEIEAMRLALYEVFLTSVSTELGVADTASIDLAIRNGLKAVVDQRFADGDISANSADERKAAIEAAAVPMCIGGGGMRDRMSDRRGSRPWDDSDDDDNDSEDEDSSDDDATPTT